MTAVIDGTAREITESPEPLPSSPPGVPTDAAPIVIPANQRYIMVLWDDDGPMAKIRCHPSFTPEQAQIILTRAGLMVLDTAQARAAEEATEPS